MEIDGHKKVPGDSNHHIDVVADVAESGEVRGAKFLFRGVEIGSIDFQRGPIAEAADVNGLTSEAILAVLVERHRFFAKVDPCVENVKAFDAMKDAVFHLHSRTRKRVDLGVEGTGKPTKISGFRPVE